MAMWFRGFYVLRVANVILRSTESYKKDPIIQGFQKLENQTKIGDNEGIQISG
ncbi:hypothetical protein IC582_017011 [Cucumis melo]